MDSRSAGAWRGAVPEAMLLAKKRRYYQARCRTESLLVPGIVECLERLAGRMPIGLATSASIDDITPTLEVFDLTSYFDVILTVESVSNPKPHPEIYLMASERLNILPRQSFAFEDSPTGATAALAAGLQEIGLTTTYDVAKIGKVIAGMADYRDLNLLARLLKLDDSTPK